MYPLRKPLVALFAALVLLTSTVLFFTIQQSCCAAGEDSTPVNDYTVIANITLAVLSVMTVIVTVLYMSQQKCQGSKDYRKALKEIQTRCAAGVGEICS